MNSGQLHCPPRIGIEDLCQPWNASQKFGRLLRHLKNVWNRYHKSDLWNQLEFFTNLKLAWYTCQHVSNQHKYSQTLP